MYPVYQLLLQVLPHNSDAATEKGRYPRSPPLSLPTPLPLPAGSPGGMTEFRCTLCTSFFFKFFLTVQLQLQRRVCILPPFPFFPSPPPPRGLPWGHDRVQVYPVYQLLLQVLPHSSDTATEKGMYLSRFHVEC